MTAEYTGTISGGGLKVTVGGYQAGGRIATQVFYISSAATFQWAGGEQATTEETDVYPGGRLQIVGDAEKLLTGGGLNVHGRADWTGHGDIRMDAWVTLNVFGTFNATASGAVTGG